MSRGLFSEGDIHEAVEVLRSSSLVDESNAAAMALLGQLLIESQEFDKFEKWLGTVSSQSARFPEYWMACGGWMLRQRDHQSAVRCFAEAVLREPGDAAAVNRLIQALNAVGDQKSAKRFRDRAEQINKSQQIVRQLLGELNLAPGAVVELSQLLGEADRPLESLAWYQVAARSTGAPPEAMQKIRDSLQQLQLPKTQAAIKKRVLCGIDLDAYPIDSVQQKLAAFSSSSGIPADVSAAQAAKVKAPPHASPVFVNVASKMGIDFQYRNAADSVLREFRIFEAYGAGVACIDYDLDGRVDLYVGQGAGDPREYSGQSPNLLSRNLRVRFAEVTLAANCDDRSYACGVTCGDWNQDGFPDLLIGNLGRNTLLINQGDGTFRKQRGDAVWQLPRYTTSVAIADVTGDALPDVVEVNYLDDEKIYSPLDRHADGKVVSYPGPLHFQPASDRVFRSVGNGQMVGSQIGSAENAKTAAANGLGIVVTDIDGQPGNEVLVANDLMANQLWQTASDPSKWTDVATAKGIAYGANGDPLACMGIATADFDGNGRLDFHVTNFEDQWSSHYLQTESGVFDDLVVAFGLDRHSYKMLGFGTQAIDFDNNSAIEIVVGNGHIEDFRHQGSEFQMATQLMGMAGNRFESLDVGGDDTYWRQGHLSRALSLCDWNNDGKMDFVVTDLQQPLALLDNQTRSDYAWLQMELVGVGSERDAIGAKVMVTLQDGRQLTQFVQTGDGYMGKNQPRLHFGLGNPQGIKHVTVRWPNGVQQRFETIQPNKLWLIVQGQDEACAREG